MLQVGPRSGVEGGATKDEDNGGQHGAGPLPVLELKGRHHGDDHDGGRQDRGDDGAPQQALLFGSAGIVNRRALCVPVLVAVIAAGHIESAVSGAFDDLD